MLIPFGALVRFILEENNGNSAIEEE